MVAADRDRQCLPKPGLAALPEDSEKCGKRALSAAH